MFVGFTLVGCGGPSEHIDVSHIDAESYGGTPAAEDRKKAMRDWLKLATGLAKEGKYVTHLGDSSMPCPGDGSMSDRLVALNLPQNLHRKTYATGFFSKASGGMKEQIDVLDVRLYDHGWTIDGKDVPAIAPLASTGIVKMLMSFFYTSGGWARFLHEILHTLKFGGEHLADSKLVAPGIDAGTAFEDVAAIGSCNAWLEGGITGEPDETFNRGALATFSETGGMKVGKIAVQPDGKAVVFAGALDLFYLIRFNADGSLDRTFGDQIGATEVRKGFTSRDAWEYDNPQDLWLDDDGKIVVVGGSRVPVEGIWKVWMARYKSNGELDTTFAGGGYTWTSFTSDNPYSLIRSRKDGKYYVGISHGSAGKYWPCITRVNYDGTFDSNFNGGSPYWCPFEEPGTSYPYSLVEQTDGKIVMMTTTVDSANYGNGTGPALRPVAARMNVNAAGMPIASLDTSFGTSSGYNAGPVTTGTGHNATSMAMTPSGKFVLGGTLNIDQGYRAVVSQLDANGRLDRSFGTDGVARIPITLASEGWLGRPTSIAVQPDGKILFSIYATADGGSERLFVFRLTAEGRVDATFSPNKGRGKSELALSKSGIYSQGAMALHSNGRIYAVGQSPGGLGINRLYGEPAYLLAH